MRTVSMAARRIRQLGAIAAVALLLATGPGAAQRVAINPPEGANWRAYSAAYLYNARLKAPYDPSRHKVTRCVRANNYGCLKQPSGTPWVGTPGPQGEDGAHDGADGAGGHAIFVHPKWSLAAAMRWFERRTRGGKERKSALQLAEIYSPWCDTLGSSATKADTEGRSWGRTCQGGKRPPETFAGPRCQRPASGTPSRAQCSACNCPSSVAETWLRGTGLATDQPLILFDAVGRPTALLQTMLAHKSLLELGGLQPKPGLLREAADVFEPSFP